MKESILRGLEAAADILLPRQCITCGQKLLVNEKHLCLECLSDLPQTYFWTMSHNPMADKFNEVIQKTLEDIGHEPYAYAAALFFYHSEADYRLIPYQIKYHGNIKAGLYFGRMLGTRLASSEIFNDVDVVIPVPLHWTRRWKRGYNQAEIIASSVAEAMGVTMRIDLLKRKRHTKTQTKMEIEEKARNVSGAFAIDMTAMKEIMKNGNTIHHILLLDDVFTTGSTLMACFQALRSIFPATVRISVATLGFVAH